VWDIDGKCSGYGKGDCYGKGDFSWKGERGKRKTGSGCADIRELIRGYSTVLELPDENTCCITGLPWNSTELDLYKLFGQFGAIPSTGVKVMTGQDGYCTGIGFVDFLERAAAEMAIVTLNGVQLSDGSIICVGQKWDGGRGKGKLQGPTHEPYQAEHPEEYDIRSQ
jgi:hypothetical protein